jgi:hypothetical protein
MNRRRTIDFQRVASAALASSLSIVQRLFPDGKRDGVEWVCHNPKRADHHVGSFKINTRTGKWSDFATGDKGGDLISLCAWRFDLKQDEAARQLARMIGVDPYV